MTEKNEQLNIGSGGSITLEDIPTQQDTERFGQRLNKLEERVDKTFERLDQRAESMTNLVVFGFIVLLIMVAAILFSYVEFVYSGSKNDDYKYTLSERVSELQTKFDTLKACFKAGGWNVCLNQ